MKRCAFFLLTLAMCIGATPLRALDLTPHYAQINADGIPMRALYFEDGKKRVFLAPPNGWKCEGGSRAATLSSDEVPGSSVLLALSTTPLLPTDAERQKAARTVVLGSAPKGAENVILQGETANPLPINGWTSHELRIEYRLLDTRFLKSVLVIKLNNREELQVIVTAPERNFPKAASTALACLNSWHKE